MCRLLVKYRIFAPKFIQLISYITVKFGQLGIDAAKGFWYVPVPRMYYETNTTISGLY